MWSNKFQSLEVRSIFERSFPLIITGKLVKCQTKLKVKFTRRIPGFYTVLSKMVDVLGQPVLEFNWNLRFSTGSDHLDKKLHAEAQHEKFVRENAGKIASMWGRSIQNAVNRKGLENLDFTFNANELKSPAEKRAEMRGHTPDPK